MRSIKHLFVKYWENWQCFWFSEIDIFPLCVFRAVFGLVFFIFVLSRSNDLEIFYTNKGFIPASYVPSVQFLTYQKSIFYYFDNLALVTICHYTLLASLLLLSIGLFTRVASIVSYFLALMFVNRNPAIQFGVDFIGMFFLFYLMFADAGASFSMDAWLKLKKRQPSALLNSAMSDPLSTIAFRLMQIQVCVIYFYSGIAKLKGSRWWNGSAIWDVMTMEGLIRFDMSFVAYFPDVLVLACYLVLFWEMNFPILIWLRPFRNPLIIFGCLMHIGFGYFLQIPTFGALMCAVYILFLEPTLLQKMLRRSFAFFTLQRQKFGMPS